MRRLRGAVSAFAVSVMILSSCVSAGNTAAPAVVEDFTGDFLRFFDDTAAFPEADRIAAFKARVAARYPAFYGIERFEGRVTQDAQDRKIARALDRFPSIRAAYTAKAAAFSQALAGNIASFRAISAARRS